jgi:hypothetical protein
MSMPFLRLFGVGRRRLSDNIESRFRKSRPGSVLILVVALLVLLALMGTAYISTTRIDRNSSAQNSFNTEIDLLIEAVCKIEQQQILTSRGAPTDAYDQSSTANASDAMLWTSPQPDTGNSSNVSNFLGSRLPSTNSSGNPIWPYLSVAPLGATFESPYVPSGQTGTLTYGTNTNLQPTSISVQTASGTTIYPALTTDGTPAHTYLAGSASGSGIADAGLFRLPLGELNGVTYYGCAYSIDNGAAVNASIAYQPNSVSATLPGDFFPTSLDLSDMLRTGSTSVTQQLTALNNYRWGATTANLSAFYDDGTALGYQFNSNLEAMWMQLGRRLDNPGLNTSGNPGVYYQTLPIGESMAMAYRYCLMNPAASPSLLEQWLAPSVTFTGSGAPVRSSAYSPDQAAQWFSDNFVYENGGGNIRPLLVARNQVSNISGSRFTYRTNSQTPQNNNWQLSTPTASVSYKFGDWVTGAAGTNGHTFVCIQDNTSAATNSPTATTEQFWAQEPWNDYPVKTSINTGTFGQLWLAYWSAMSATTPDQPDSASSTAMFRNPIRGAVSAAAPTTNPAASPVSSGNTLTVSPTGGDDTANIQAIINSSQAGDTIAFAAGTYTISSTLQMAPNRIYSGGGAASVSGIAALTPSETLRLRAAIAAINSQQLRGNNSQLLSRQIMIGGAISAPMPAVTGGANLTWSGASPGNGLIAMCTGGTTTEITGFTVTGGGLELQAGTFNVHGNGFQNAQLGVFVAGNSGHIDDNTFTGMAQGIYGYPGDNGTYSNNTINGTTGNDGIHLAAAAGNGTVVSGNVITGVNRIPIELQLSGTGIQCTNNFVQNIEPPKSTGGSWMGLSVACGYSNGTTVTGNTCTNTQAGVGQGAAIEIIGTNPTVSNNVGWGYSEGILNGAQGSALTANGNTFYGGTLEMYDGVQGAIAPLTGNNTVLPLSAMPNPPAAPQSGGGSSSTTQPTASTASLTYRVMLYGTGQQPYVTEAYANNDQSTGVGFVAVSMYNPYSTPINLTGWQWITVARPNGAAQLTFAPLDPNNPGLGVSTIAPYQRLVFASKAPADMPSGIAVDSGATYVPAPALANTFDKELVLVRPRSAGGNLTSTATYNPQTQTYSNITDPNNIFDETVHQDGTQKLSDLVPVDSYDFTGLTAPNPNSTNSAEWHYVRPSDIASHNWYFVYPYTYDKTPADNTSPNALAATAATLPLPRLFATQVSPGATPTPTALGAADTAPVNTAYTAKFPIQINNTDFGGPKATASQFPFGGFARNGDILQTTFIGTYRIDLVALNADDTVSATTPATVVEYQPVTMDSAFADDLNDNDNQAENVGRFCPLNPADCGNLFNDFDSSGPPSAYHFAMRLYDFLTVSAPADDYMQNVRAADNTVPYGVANVKPSVINAYSNPSMPTTEDSAPTDGLININTASWRVLATLPMANNSATSAANIALAKAIVQYRDVDNGTTSHTPHGPFKSILELNGVPNFRTTLYSTGLNVFNPKGLDNGPADGDLAPFISSAPYDQVPGDFEKQFLAFNRISNLVTVRSDSFTTYVLVQGWRNAGTATPELVVQRRAAFFSDRSGSIPSNKVLNITNIPVN